MYCNTLVCIAEKRAETLLDCVVTQGRDTVSQATTWRWARGARRLALGRRRWSVGRAGGDMALGAATRPSVREAGL